MMPTSDTFIDIWQASLEALPEQSLQTCRLLLNAEEQRAADIKPPLLQRRFIFARGLLRQTLAKYLNTCAKHLNFARGEFGKPYLIDYPLHFNLSHSGDDLLIAVANVAVGIDIERQRNRNNMAALAKRCFADSELNYWQALPSCEQLGAFYQLWTQKEAFVKATGRGLGLGLEQCVFDGEKPRLIRIPAEYGDAQDWTVLRLDCGDKLCAAAVICAQDVQFRHLYLDI